MTYAGLIIDGPMDGQRIENEKPVFQVALVRPELLGLHEALKKPAAQMVLEDERVTYRHHRTIKGCDLWLLEGMTIPRVIAHMVNRIGVEALASRYEQITLRQQDDARHDLRSR